MDDNQLKAQNLPEPIKPTQTGFFDFTHKKYYSNISEKFVDFCAGVALPFAVYFILKFIPLPFVALIINLLILSSLYKIRRFMMYGYITGYVLSLLSAFLIPIFFCSANLI